MLERDFYARPRLKFSRSFAQKDKSKIILARNMQRSLPQKVLLSRFIPTMEVMPSARTDFQNANCRNPQILKMSAILAFSLAVILVQYELKGANRSGCMNNSTAVAESHEGWKPLVRLFLLSKDNTFERGDRYIFKWLSTLLRGGWVLRHNIFITFRTIRKTWL
jgi:hypothetical protein